MFINTEQIEKEFYYQSDALNSSLSILKNGRNYRDKTSRRSLTPKKVSFRGQKKIDFGKNMSLKMLKKN